MILLHGLLLPILLLIFTFFINFSSIIVFFVKIFIIALDVLTLLPSLILHLRQKSSKRIPSKRIFSVKDGDDYIRIGKRANPFDIKGNSTTFKELIEFCFNKYSDKPLFGTREVLQDDYEINGNKKIRKLLLANEYTFLTFKQANSLINFLVKLFIDEGIKPRDRVILFSETRLEWMLSFFALSKLNAIAVTLYANLDNNGIIHIFQECESKYLIASKESYYRLKKLFPYVNHIQKIFALDKLTETDDIGNEKYKYVFLCDEIKKEIKKLRNNDDDNNEKIEKMNITLPEAKPTDEILIMYTSGSEGLPKGVLLSHQNIISSVSSLYSSCLGHNERYKDETFLAYLPLAHIFELCCELIHLLMGFKIAYSSPLTMLDTSPGLKPGVKGDISISKPTTIPMVPLMLERIKQTIETKTKDKGEIFWKIFNFFLAHKRFWKRYGFSTPISDKIIFGKIRKNFGGRWKICYSGSAPLSSETQSFIRDILDLFLMQGYASTETASSASLMDAYDESLGTAGSVLFDCRIRLIDWKSAGYFTNDNPSRGEILISSNSLTSNYFNRPEENKKNFIILDERRYWKSGDIGEISEEGIIKIIDRKKNLIKLQHGEYISLGRVEAALKNCKYIENICVCGNGLYDYLVALVTVNNVNINELTNSQNIFESDGLIEKKLLELIKETGVREGLTSREIPKKIKICKEEWTTDNEMITAIQKIRRNKVYSFYKKNIEELYAS